MFPVVSNPHAGCISAANGVGCVLAEMGNYTAAKEVFLQVSWGDDSAWQGSCGGTRPPTACPLNAPQSQCPSQCTPASHARIECLPNPALPHLLP